MGGFSVRFWGVRGSIACPGPEYARYGGNTSCLEVRCGDHLLIFDAGTGLRDLGLSLQRRGPVDGDLFLTHTHMDHIGGIPFCAPFFDGSNQFRLWCGHLGENEDLLKVLREFMKAPLFPVPPEIFQASLAFIHFHRGEVLTPADGIRVRTAPLSHPNGAVGYRVEYGGRSLCYCTDTEHEIGRLDDSILELIQDADILIYDSTYTDEEYVNHVGWGHSTWQEGIRLCEAANVSTFVLFHHDPAHDDQIMDQIAADAVRRRPGTLVAREGMTIHLETGEPVVTEN